jgi:hypothetical protein
MTDTMRVHAASFMLGAVAGGLAVASAFAFLITRAISG